MEGLYLLILSHSALNPWGWTIPACICDNYCCDLRWTIDNYCASLLITVQPSALNAFSIARCIIKTNIIVFLWYSEVAIDCFQIKWSDLQICEMLRLHAASVSHNQHGGSKTSSAAKATVHHSQETRGGYPILCFPFLNKASFPTTLETLWRLPIGRVAVPTAHHPAKTASSHIPLVAMVGWWAESLHRDVLQKVPSQALLQWESHNAQAQLFPGSLQHCQLTRILKQVQLVSSHQ